MATVLFLNICWSMVKKIQLLNNLQRNGKKSKFLSIQLQKLIKDALTRQSINHNSQIQTKLGKKLHSSYRM
jgi:hypothetical protein